MGIRPVLRHVALADVERELAEHEHVTRADPRTLDALAVHERTVARAEIAELDPGLVGDERSVAARDGGVEQRDVAGERASDGQRCAAAQLEDLIAVGADEAERHSAELSGSGRWP